MGEGRVRKACQKRNKWRPVEEEKEKISIDVKKEKENEDKQRGLSYIRT